MEGSSIVMIQGSMSARHEPVLRRWLTNAVDKWGMPKTIITE